MALTKDDLIKAIAESNGYSRDRAQEIVEMLLELMKASLSAGDDVLISGFGKFCVRPKRERRGRNPATGGSMQLAARRVVTFKCSGQLRNKIDSIRTD